MMTQEKKQIPISVLIVNYRSLAELELCLRHLNKVISKKSVEILIANNDQQPLPVSLETIATNALCTKIFHMEDNKGFGAANNYIAKAAKGHVLFFLNPDTYDFSDGIDALVHQIKEGRCDVLAPKIYNPDGTRQLWSYGKKISPQSVIFNNIKSVLTHDNSTKGLEDFQGNKGVDWVTGAAFLIKRRDFLEVGGFDEAFFLYFEDIDLCKRLKGQGKMIQITDEVSLKHSSGASATSAITQKKHYYKAQDLYMNKHHSPLVAKTFSFLRDLTRTQ